MIQFKCPACGKSLSVRDELAGKKGKCRCGAVLHVPQPIAGDAGIASPPGAPARMDTRAVAACPPEAPQALRTSSPHPASDMAGGSTAAEAHGAQDGKRLTWREKAVTAVQAAKNELAIARAKSKRKAVDVALAPLAEECGGLAISDAVAFEDASLAAMCDSGVATLAKIKEDKAKRDEQANVLASIDATLEKAKADLVQAQIGALDETIERETQSLHEAQKRLGHAIVAAGFPSEYFAEHRRKKEALDREGADIVRKLEELTAKRDSLRGLLGFNVKKVCLIAGGVLLVGVLIIALLIVGRSRGPGAARYKSVAEIKKDFDRVYSSGDSLDPGSIVAVKGRKVSVYVRMNNSPSDRPVSPYYAESLGWMTYEKLTEDFLGKVASPDKKRALKITFDGKTVEVSYESYCDAGGYINNATWEAKKYTYVLDEKDRQ